MEVNKQLTSRITYKQNLKESTDLLNMPTGRVEPVRIEVQREEDSVRISENSSEKTPIEDNFTIPIVSTKNLILASNNSSAMEESSSLRKCLICDEKKYPELLHEAECGHLFCIRCVKAFLEDCIENGEKDLKCPLFDCKEAINKRFYTKILSEPYEKKLEANKELLAQSHSALKPYIKQNVLEMAHTETLLEVYKFKESRCATCNEKALFGKEKRRFAKCLKCFNYTCKFCGKNYSADHFKVSSFNYCRIAFRKKLFEISDEPIRPSLFKECLLSILLFSLAFLLIPVSLTNYLLFTYSSSLKEKSVFLFVLYLVAVIPLIPLSCVFSLLLLPYLTVILTVK